MIQKIKYYQPIQQRNKANTANLTIDWYKKNFLLPINTKYYEQLPYEEESFDYIPQLGWTLAFDNELFVFQGQVQSIAVEKSMDEEIIHVFLYPYKKRLSKDWLKKQKKAND